MEMVSTIFLAAQIGSSPSFDIDGSTLLFPCPVERVSRVFRLQVADEAPRGQYNWGNELSFDYLNRYEAGFNSRWWTALNSPSPNPKISIEKRKEYLPIFDIGDVEVFPTRLHRRQYNGNSRSL